MNFIEFGGVLVNLDNIDRLEVKYKRGWDIAFKKATWYSSEVKEYIPNTKKDVYGVHLENYNFNIYEDFKTEEEAKNRFNELKKKLIKE